MVEQYFRVVITGPWNVLVVSCERKSWEVPPDELAVASQLIRGIVSEAQVRWLFEKAASQNILGRFLVRLNPDSLVTSWKFPL